MLQRVQGVLGLLNRNPVARQVDADHSQKAEVHLACHFLPHSPHRGLSVERTPSVQVVQHSLSVDNVVKLPIQHYYSGAVGDRYQKLGVVGNDVLGEGLVDLVVDSLELYELGCAHLVLVGSQEDRVWLLDIPWIGEHIVDADSA